MTSTYDFENVSYINRGVFDDSGFSSDLSWDHQYQFPEQPEDSSARHQRQYLSPTSFDTDHLLGACDRLLDRIDETLEPLVRVPHSNPPPDRWPNFGHNTGQVYPASTHSFAEELEFSVTPGNLDSMNPESDNELVEVEPPSQEDAADQGSPVEDEIGEEEPQRRVRRPNKSGGRRTSPKGHRHKQTTIKILPISAVPHMISEKRTTKAVSPAKNFRNYGRHSARSGGKAAHRRQTAPNGASSSAPSTYRMPTAHNNSNSEDNKHDNRNITYIPVEGNMPVCVYKVQNVESSDSTNGCDDGSEEARESRSSLKSRGQQRSKTVKGVPVASLDDWERQQIDKLKHNIEKMTTKYFAGVPLSSSFRDIQLDSDLETVESSVVNEKFDAAYKAAKRALSPPVVNNVEHFSDDEFIVTAKPLSKPTNRYGQGQCDSPSYRSASGLTYKSQSSRHINERPVSQRNSEHRYVDDIHAIREDIWQLSEQRTKAMSEVAEVSNHLKCVLEELQSSQFQVDEYNAHMEMMRREFDEAERKKEKLYQELTVLQNELQTKQPEQQNQQVVPDETQKRASPTAEEQIEKLVESQVNKMLTKAEECHVKERQELEAKIEQLEAEVNRNAAAEARSKMSSQSSRRSHASKSPTPERQEEVPAVEVEESQAEPPVEGDALKEKVEALEKELKFMAEKLKEAALDKEAVAEKRLALEDKVKRLEGERDNLLELFLRNERLPPEYAAHALRLAEKVVSSPENSYPVPAATCPQCAERQQGICTVDACVSPGPPELITNDNQQQNIDDVLGHLQDQLVDVIERKLANSQNSAVVIDASLLREKEAELEQLQAQFRLSEEQHQRQVDTLMKTIEEHSKERLRFEEIMVENESNEKQLTEAGKRCDQLSQQVLLLQAQIELDREQSKLSIEEKTTLLEKVQEDKIKDIARIRSQIEEEKKFDVSGLEAQLDKIRTETQQLEAERQRDLDLFANGLVNFDRLETSLVNDINEECRKIASLMEVTPRRVKLMTFRIERAANPAQQFNTILNSSSSPIFVALVNLQSTCQELRDFCIRQKNEAEEKRDAIRKVEGDKIDEMEQLRMKLMRDKQEEITSLKEAYLKEHRAEVERIKAEERQSEKLQIELKQKDCELKEIESHMSHWKEETIDKLTNKLTMKFVEEMEKAAKNQTKVVREIERRLNDRTRELERAQREISFLRQLRNITDSTVAARCALKEAPYDTSRKFEEEPPLPSVDDGAQKFTSPSAVNDLKASLKATAADCIHADNTATLKRRAVRLQTQTSRF